MDPNPFFLELDKSNAHALDLEWNFTDRADRLYWIGHRLFVRGFFADAAEVFDRATRYDHTHYNAYVGQVEMLVVLGRLDEAERVAEEALARYGRNASLGAARGHVFLHRDNLSDALACLDIATRNDPENAYPWLLAGEARLRMPGGLPYAEQCFDKAKAACEPWPYPHVRIALAFLEWGFAAQAVERLAPLAKANPEMPLPWVLLGDAQRLMGRWADSDASYRRALDLAPGLESIRLALHWRNRLAARLRYFSRRVQDLLVPPEAV